MYQFTSVHVKSIFQHVNMPCGRRLRHQLHSQAIDHRSAPSQGCQVDVSELRQIQVEPLATTVACNGERER